MRAVITGRKPGEQTAPIDILGIKIQSFVAVRDLVARNRVAVAVRRHNPVIPHICNVVVLDFGIVRIAEPNPVQSIADCVAVHAIACAKAQFDRVIEDTRYGVGADGIVITAGLGMRLDENAVPISTGHCIVHSSDPARPTLNDDATGIAAVAHCAGAPCALADIVGSDITGRLAVESPDKVDAPCRIVGRRVRAHGNVARVADVNADGLVDGGISHDVGIRSVVHANSTAIGRAEEDAIPAVGVGIVIVVRAVVVMDDKILAGFNPYAVFETGHATITDLDIGRGLAAEQTVFAN